MNFRKTIAGIGAAVILAAGTPASATNLTGVMTADNAFFAYLGTSANSLGTLVGSGNNWAAAFNLASTALTPGVTNYLNIEAINYGGPGGISFVLNLSDSGFQFGNGTQTLTTNLADLPFISASFNSTNSNVAPQPWVPATGSVVANNGYPWGNIAGTANWADAGVNGLNAVQFSTVDFTIAIRPTNSAVPEPASWALMLVGFGLVGHFMRRAQRARSQRVNYAFA